MLGGKTQVDLGLPTTVPIAAFIGDVVALIESRNPDPVESEEGAVLVAQHWTLSRLGRDPISPDSTLVDAEVFDGELLILRAETPKDAPALFDDVIDAVARLADSAFRDWSDEAARWSALLIAGLAIPFAVVLLSLSRWHVAAGVIAVSAGLLAGGTAVVVARNYRLDTVAAGLSLSAVTLTGPGTALFIPGGVGSAHALLGCAVSLVVAVGLYRLTGAGATLVAMIATLTAFGGIAAGLILAFGFSPIKVAAGLVAAAVTFVTPTAQLARAAAKLPVPPVPTAGGAIDPADHEPRPTIEGIGAIGATALPSAVGLADRARAANRYQSGMIIGAVGTVVPAAFIAADTFGSQRWQGLVLATIVGVVLSLRGRAYADLTQAGAMICGGAAIAVAVAVGVGLGNADRLLWSAGALLFVTALALFVGVAGPATDISPVTRRAGELLEYGLIIAIIPLVVWIMDLYSYARNI
ncbi:MAG: type VII secretion integral membrane protein EccD [Mycobacteriaceae bacterium]|nr:type VII secretion integral membrane protein EccD [Mycobacteriaceae bacterium]